MADPYAKHDPWFGAELLGYAANIKNLDTPECVLEKLHAIAWESWQLGILAALQFPMRWGDWKGLEKGKTVFLHKSLPQGWWDEFLELNRTSPAPGLTMAQLALAPYTMSETMRLLEPLGIDRWPHELALKYGVRDTLTCPVGGRWVVVFWSRSVVSKRLTEEARALLFMGATFAAIRLQALISPYAKRIGNEASLTPRELAVLRLLSVGKRLKGIAQHLELGEETVRSHLKKAEEKLGVHDRSHAVAQAIRQHLIP